MIVVDVVDVPLENDEDAASNDVRNVERIHAVSSKETKRSKT